MASALDAKLEQLINQARSPDADVKVDALTKLQAEFESGAELHETDAVLTTLKTCLRTPNQHVSTAAMAAITPFFPLLVTSGHAPLPSSNSSSSSAMGEAATLRHALTAFLATGGVLDRLGDNRDKARERARDAVVAIAGITFKHGGHPVPPAAAARLQKAPETPLSMLERYIREGAFAHKAWRVREQIILSLVQIRRENPGFPLRPYLPLLVDTLEDSDGTVRDCSRESVVQIFSSSSVSDAARADLKKEMLKKGVRKTIVDSVLARVLNSGVITPQSEAADSDSGLARPRSGVGVSRTASSSSDQTQPAITPARPKSRTNDESSNQTTSAPPVIEGAAGSLDEVAPVYILSARDLEAEMAQMTPAFEGKETEHNWSARDKSIARLRGMLKGDVQTRYPDVYLAGLKAGMLDKSFKTLVSLRTTVATNTCNFYIELAQAFGVAIDPFVESLLMNLLKMSGYTKKIIATLTQSVVTTIIERTSCHPKVSLPMFASFVQEKIVGMREYMMQHIRRYLEVHGQRSKHQVEATNALEHVEKSIKRGLGDANPGVREHARKTFWAFHALWPNHATIIMDALDVTGKKQLQKACPNPAALLSATTAASEPKKPSVAAAIAANRAKAKQIAAAPPTLRHQATSTAHAVRATSPPLSRGAVRSASPSSPAARGRASPIQSPSAHGRARSSSGNNTPPSPPPSPPSPKSTRRPPAPASPLASHSSPRSVPSGRLPPQASHSAPATTLHATSSTVPQQSRSLFMHSSAQASTPARPSPDDDLLLATTIPVPPEADSDSDQDEVLSFSSPYEKYAATPLTPAKSAPMSVSQHDLFASPPPPSAMVPEHVVEDAMRARAEQAVSSADRLLEELVDEDDMHESSIPPSLLLTNGSAMRPSPVLKSLDTIQSAAPRQQSSLTVGNDDDISIQSTTRLGKGESGWWLTRMSVLEQNRMLQPDDQQLRDVMLMLEQGVADLAALRLLAALCTNNPASSSSPTNFEPPLTPNGNGGPISPTPGRDVVSALRPLGSDIWLGGKLFDKVFVALLNFLDNRKIQEETDIVEHGLVVLWEMLEHQPFYVDGHESEIYALLFHLRYSNNLHALQGTTEIRDVLATRLDPVFGLMTVNAALKGFLSESLPPDAVPEMRTASLAFGLIAFAKFTVRLPSEVIEEELPRLKTTLIASLNDTSSLVVRESATVAIIAAQIVLRDETHLFMLLDGLANDKKNLLTYFFEKHGVRDVIQGTTDTSSGMERLEKEMRRLDTRMNTPARPKE